MLFSKRKIAWWLSTAIFFIAIIWVHNVPNHLTKADISTIEQFLQKHAIRYSTSSFDGELALIADLQKALNQDISCGKGISLGQPREPQNLLSDTCGACYDRSRLLEKTLRYLGFQTRHFSAFAKQTGQSRWQILTTRNTPSHAAFEVLTQKGWLVVDPIFEWTATDTMNEPFSFSDIKNHPKTAWRQPLPDYLTPFFGDEPGYAVYGLYSRHGRFFSPYNFIPDYNFREVLYNFSSR